MIAGPFNGVAKTGLATRLGAEETIVPVSCILRCLLGGSKQTLEKRNQAETWTEEEEPGGHRSAGTHSGSDRSSQSLVATSREQSGMKH